MYDRRCPERPSPRDVIIMRDGAVRSVAQVPFTAVHAQGIEKHFLNNIGKFDAAIQLLSRLDDDASTAVQLLELATVSIPTDGSSAWEYVLGCVFDATGYFEELTEQEELNHRHDDVLNHLRRRAE